MSYVIPSVSQFKSYFNRDFPYGVTLDTITDDDVTKAMELAGVNFSEEFWANQQAFNIGYLLLSAHYLVLNIRESSQGIAGNWSWNQSARSVGSVSESLSIPQRILDNPEYAFFTSTNYGAKYLMLILPQLSGQMYAVFGGTNP